MGGLAVFKGWIVNPRATPPPTRSKHLFLLLWRVCKKNVNVVKVYDDPIVSGRWATALVRARTVMQPSREPERQTNPRPDPLGYRPITREPAFCFFDPALALEIHERTHEYPPWRGFSGGCVLRSGVWAAKEGKEQSSGISVAVIANKGTKRIPWTMGACSLHREMRGSWFADVLFLTSTVVSIDRLLTAALCGHFSNPAEFQEAWRNRYGSSSNVHCLNLPSILSHVRSFPRQTCWIYRFLPPD